MAGPLQEYLAGAAERAAADLETALLGLPEDRRGWSPMGGARTALDMVAECAVLHATIAGILRDHAFPADFDMAAYQKAKDDLARDGAVLLAALRDATAAAAAAIRAVPDADLPIEFASPFGPMTVSQVIAYPFWNACYHEGQINYLSAMLGAASE